MSANLCKSLRGHRLAEGTWDTHIAATALGGRVTELIYDDGNSAKFNHGFIDKVEFTKNMRATTK